MEVNMPVTQDGYREIVSVQRDETVLEAAKLMRRHHVGDLQVIEERDGVNVPVGIVTERDLVVEIMAPELDYMVITVGDIIDLHAF
jgi:CBS domain-containing protein